MSRYIDAEKAIAHFNLMYDEQEDKDDPYNVGVMGAINYIKHRAPSIDIVRCKECMFADVDAEAEMARCSLVSFPLWHRGDYFCADGERKGE